MIHGVAATSALRVLLVEDNPGDADLLRERLADVSRPTIALEHVERLRTAIETVKSRDPFDVILLDLELPDSSGFSTLERLLGIVGSTPIVVLTGLGDEDHGLTALQRGAQDYLDKGTVTGRALLKSILYAIERARLRREIESVVSRNLDAMVIVGRDGIVRSVNEAASRLFAKSPDMLVGSTFPFPVENLSSSLVTIERSPGELVAAQMLITMLEWNNEPSYLVSIRDITDLQRAQDLERQLMHADRLASIGQLAAGVAHEVNNPAAFVQANITLVSEQLDELEALARAGIPAAGTFRPKDGAGADPRDEAGRHFHLIREMLSDCAVGMERIVSIVRDLSTFSRIEHDAVEPIDLNDLVNIACNIAKNEIRHRARLVKAQTPMPPITGDRAKLTQVIVNLLVNAAHAISEEGSSDRNRIEVSTTIEDDRLIISVADTGSGIEQELIDHVFEPFFTTKPRGQGTGLGLAIAAETIRKHDGTMRITSEVGVGTRVDVVLPMDTRLDSNAPSGGLERMNDGVMAPQRARILLVDDEAMLRRALRRILDRHHDVVESVGGDNAISIIEHDGAFDVILCDLMMPERDGPSLHEYLAKQHPELAKRMVFLTGGVFSPRAKDFIAAMNPVVLEKPVAKGRLLASVADVLQVHGRISVNCDPSRSTDHGP